MSVVHLTQKGQILVPKHLRRKLGLKPGGKVHLAEEEGRLVLTPVPPDPIEAATGFLKGRFSLTQDLRREHREEQDAGHGEHEHLGPQARAPPVGDEHAPRGGEAEGGVVEHDA